MPTLQSGSTPTTEGSSHLNDASPLSVQSRPPGDAPGVWSPLPISVSPNRPDFSATDSPYSTPTLAPLTNSATTNGRSVNTAALAGGVVSAGIILVTVAFAIVWWRRKGGEGSKSYHNFGHGQQQQQPGAVEEEEEKPPTYEAAVFGIHRDGQTQQSVPVAPPPILQNPPLTHNINSPRPFNAAAANRTLHRLDTTVPHHQNITGQHADIVIYPHDSPPPTPSPSARQNTSPTTIPLPQINFNSGGGEVLASHHITDFSEDYPDTVSFNSDFSDTEATVAKEIV